MYVFMEKKEKYYVDIPFYVGQHSIYKYMQSYIRPAK